MSLFCCYLPNFTALGSQLVDLGLSDVSALMRLLQLILHLPVPGQVSVGLLLLLGLHKISKPFQSIALMALSVLNRKCQNFTLKPFDLQLLQLGVCRPSLSAAACLPDLAVGSRSSCLPQSLGVKIVHGLG